MILNVAESAARLRIAEVVMAGLALLFVLVGASSVVYMMYLDTTPPFISTVAYTMNAEGERQSVFRSGDIMLVHRDFCAQRDVSLSFTRSLRRVSDKLYVHINTTTGALRKGCVDGPNFIRLPQAPPGTYQFVNTVTFSNNALQSDMSVELPAPVIEIVR